MMRREDIVSKGLYTYPQIGGLIAVKQYIVVRQKREKSLLLRMTNERSEKVTGLSFRVREFDAKGNLIGTRTVEEKKLALKPGASFNVNQKIKLNDACVDFKVDVLSVRCGAYLHTVKGGEVVTSYMPEEKPEKPLSEGPFLKKMKGERYVVSSRIFNPKKLLIWICCTVVFWAALLTAVQLYIFMSTETLFTLDNVEYRFETENRVDGPICIVGYTGSARNVVIPAEIEGHTVSRIESMAFANSRLRSIVIEGATVVEDGAFRDCYYLQSASMEQVPSVGAYAFAGCDNLERVSMNGYDSVLGDYAFYRCSSLEEVLLPATMDSIGSNAFAYCTSLSTLNLPSRVDTLGEGMLYGCYSLKQLSIPYLGSNEEDDGTIGYLFATSEAWALPQSPISLTVTNEDTVPAHAFSGCQFLGSVVFLQDVTSVGEYAFFNCASLTSVDGLEEITSMDTYAFAQCHSLKGLVLGDELTELPPHAFSQCGSLRTLRLPAKLTRIGSRAFYNCNALTELSIPATVEVMGADFLRGCSSLEKLTIPFLGRSDEEPGTMKQTLGSGNTSLKRVSILRGPSLAPNAFNGYTSLETVVLPYSMTEIGSEAFADCRALTTVEMPSALTTIRSGAFRNCQALTKISLPSTVVSLEAGIFENCASLKGVTMPSKITAIPRDTFSGCGSLITFNIPENVTSVDDGAFRNCTALRQISLPAKLTTLGTETFSGCTALKSVVLPSSVTTIPEKAFSGCTSLSSVTLPTFVRVIGPRAFANCTALGTVALPDSLQYLNAGAFSGSGLTEVTISENIVSIEAGVFANCKALKSMSLPFLGASSDNRQVLGYFFTTSSKPQNSNVPASLKSVKILNGESLAESAFSSCGNLTTIDLPATLQTVPANAFASCSSLQSVELPTSVQLVGSYAFSNCVSLNKIELPVSVSTISDYAFQGCSALKDITIPNAVQTMGQNVFYGCSSLKSITLPFVGRERLNSYTFDYIFGTVPSSLTTVVLTDCTEIVNGAFSGCSGLTTVTLPEGLTAVGANAFRDCTSLTEITVPESVTMMGSYAFYGCESLKTLTVPFLPSSGDSGTGGMYSWFGDSYYNLTKVTVTNSSHIPAYALAYCYNLKEINLPENLTDIGSYAFAHCNALREITLPENLTYVGDYAFDGCYRLYAVTNQSQMTFDQSGWDYTYLTEYALTITENGEKPVRVTQNDFVFLLADNGAWYLVDYLGSSSSWVLAERFTYDGAYIDQYQIPRYAFQDNGDLTSLHIPSSVTYIDENAFSNCYNLQSLTFAADSVLRRIACNVFSSAAITKLVLPDSVEYVDPYAFAYCYGLKSVTIPKDVSNIGYDAFWGCENLREVYNLGDLDIQIGSTDHGYVAYYAYVLHDSEKDEPLTEVTVDKLRFLKSGYQWFLIGYDGYITNLNLTSFTYNGKLVDSYRVMPYAFQYNYDLQSVVIGDAVTEIQPYAFASCGNLVTVSFSDNSQLRTLPDSVFANCENLRTVTLPTSLKVIGQRAFYDCYQLSSITLPSQLTEIGEHAFYNCSALTYINIPASVSTIGSRAFYYCSALETVEFASVGSLTEIPTYCFRYCQALKSLKLPEGVSTIGSYAFYNCSALETVILPDTLQSIGTNAFYGCSAMLEVVNPSSLSITAGSSTHGRVAQYALAVHSSEAQMFERKTVTDANSTYYFIHYNNEWCLYAIETKLSDSDTMQLPVLTENGKTVSYNIIRNALSGACYRLMIPASVANIDSSSQSYVSNNMSIIYYGGTESEWKQLMTYGYSNKIYYYADCVHESGQWTYISGSIVTSVTSRTLIETIAATCDAEGKKIYQCTRCTQTWETILAREEHSLNSSHACSKCGDEATKITLENIGSLSGLVNDTTNPFTVDETGTFKSGSVAQIYSNLTLTADRDMTVSFDYYLVDGTNSDYIRIYLNGTSSTSVSGSSTTTRTYQVNLKEGDVLRIRFQNRGGTTAVYATAVIDNLYILER